MSVELISIEEAVKKASEYVHLVVKNIKEGEIDLTDLVYINESKGAELRKYSLNSDDIIIALSSNVGNSSLFDINEEDVQFTLSHYLARIKCDKRKINPKILVYYLNSKAIWKYFRVCETGKTKKNISKVYIRNLPILLDLDKQEEMLKKITRIEESISKIRSELKIYEMLREDITDKFLVGQ
ncbi:MAG: hypothetical protein GX941_01510 [Candidatus Methanofastidiosa archaeon]|jgi:type I restriction enzyme S subunit|nr:hypothetical protein [Candidatus Methanofastidiosa archaeon]HOM95781.1 hypothetical protein [Methanofastidiosum sp.]HPC81018.1 hypothetical protein [Methanofastidiosum sp.]HRS25849.1 hypothetical protein [Methanofastidiosum sp.]